MAILQENEVIVMNHKDRIKELRAHQKNIKKGKALGTAQYVCRECEQACRAVRLTRGRFWLEVTLWILFFPVGIVYSIWRLSTRYNGCPACGSERLVDAETPAGKRLLGKVNAS